MRKLFWGAAFCTALITAVTSTAFATGGSMTTITPVSVGRFGEMDLRVGGDHEHGKKERGSPYKLRLKTKGESDVHVVTVKFEPGGHSGWHAHPGPSLITVTAGTITIYHGDDPNCVPHQYTVGMGFVEQADAVHIVRNEGDAAAAFSVVQILPAEGTRRIDKPVPGNCPF